MSATIRDVAKLAQVSPATVSRYFTGSNVVGTEISKRIEAATETLGYAPNRTVRINQGVIIVLVPNLELGYFCETAKEIIRQMPKYKCKIIFLPTMEGDESYKYFFKDLNVTGVIYLDEDLDKDMIRYIRSKNLKIVMLGGASFESNCDMVHINDMAAGYEGMRYLLSLNHREILILADFPRNISSGYQRLFGCQQALKEYNLSFDQDKMVEFGYLTYENGYQSVQKALKQGKKFTAIFAYSDDTAMGAISALKDHGIRVPEDVSVLGFDGISVSKRVVPKLSTIYQPIDKMVAWTLDYLCESGRKKQEMNTDYILPYQLVEGETCIRREE